MAGMAALRLIGKNYSTLLCIVDKDRAAEVEQAMKALASAAQSPLELRLIGDRGEALAHVESSTVPALRTGRW